MRDGVVEDDAVPLLWPGRAPRQFLPKLRQQFQDLGLGGGIGRDALCLYFPQPESNLAVLVRVEMAVCVQGNLDRGVPHAPGNLQDVEPHLNQEGGMGVPES